MTRTFGLALVVIGVLVAGIGVTDAGGPVKIELMPQNNSGEKGTATLTENGSKTKVVVAVEGAPAGVAQPMHVHKGTCDKLDAAPAYGLTSLTNGKSETTIDVPLATLQKGPFAINGHKSAQDAKTYVFCGNIPAM